jgi:hypothetical protein
LYAHDYEQSEHRYQHLLFDWMNGRQTQAWQAYLQWKQVNAPREIDDLPMMYVDYLAETVSLEQALTELESLREQETNRFRKTQLRYHRAELLHRHGQVNQARLLYKELHEQLRPKVSLEARKKAKNRKQLEQLYTDEFTPLLHYTQQGLAWAYLTDSDPDSVKMGQMWLKQNTASYDERFRRQSLRQFIRYMETEGETGFVRQALDTLASVGSRRQRTQARLKRIGFELKQGEYQLADSLWQELNTEWELGLIPPSQLNEWMRQENGLEQVQQQLNSEAQLVEQFNKGGRRKQTLRQRLLHKRSQLLMAWLEQWESQSQTDTELDEVLVRQSDESVLPTEEQRENQELRQKQRERKEKREKRREEKRQRELERAQQENEQ